MSTISASAINCAVAISAVHDHVPKDLRTILVPSDVMRIRGATLAAVHYSIPSRGEQLSLALRSNTSRHPSEPVEYVSGLCQLCRIDHSDIQ